MNEISKYRDAVVAIKTAILQGQYEAARGVNRIQLAVYFGVGKYLSLNTRKGVWGTGALESISSQLQREMPGLRGFSAESLKLMRRFYEEWDMLDSGNSVIAITELQNTENQIDIFRELQLPNLKDFPVEDFLKVPFTHHSRIINSVKTIDERCYYIRRCAEEHLSVGRLKRLMDDDAFHHQAEMPNNFGATLPAAEVRCRNNVANRFLSTVRKE